MNNFSAIGDMMTKDEIRLRYYEFATKQIIAWANLYGTRPATQEQARINPLWTNNCYGLHASLIHAFYGHKLTSELGDDTRYAIMMIDLADMLAAENA